MRFLLFFSVLALIFVNGWTDAPNAIATAVSTGSLPFRRAVFLAAPVSYTHLDVYKRQMYHTAQSLRYSRNRSPAYSSMLVLSAL